ncbi:MAG: transaldolase [Myxococcota bacterium]|jgi:transaldolase
MKFFVEGSVEDATSLAGELGLCGGVVLPADAPATTPETVSALVRLVDGPVFVSVSADDTSALLAVARNTARANDYIVVSLPISAPALAICKTCYEEGIAVNITGCATAAQALLAASANATYASVPMGPTRPADDRRDDPGSDGAELLQDVMAIYDGYDLETLVIAVGLTDPEQVTAAALAGAHAALVTAGLMRAMITL